MKFKQLLKEKCYTCGTLAKALDIGRQTVYQWSWGKSTPNPKTILKIKELLKVSAEEILQCFVEE